MTSPATSRHGDMVGMSLSGLCLVHCVLLGPLLALLPVVGAEALPGWEAYSEWFHAALLVPVLLVSGPLLLRGARTRPLIGVLALVAFAALGGALFVGGEATEQAWTVTGSLLLVLAHSLNLRRRPVH